MHLVIPFIAAGTLAAFGAFRQVTHNAPDSRSLNPTSQKALATLEPSNNRSRASLMLKSS
jgi:hypothetical protein